MKKLDIVSHILLIAGIATGFVAIMQARWSGQVQFLVILSILFFYLAWGLVYHFAKHDLSRKLYLEYLIIASICAVSAILIFLL